MHRQGRRWIRALAISGWLAAGSVAMAQQFSAFHVGNSKPIMDESGSNTVYGNAQSGGCLVQIIQVTDTNNPYLPPFYMSGAVNTDIVVMAGGETYIGAQVSPVLDQPGLFAKTFNDPTPAGGAKLFVRVFNSSNEFDATYYGDSQVFTYMGNDFDAEIGGTTNALDMTDSDGDGVNNRWEIYYGTDPYKADSDGDGISDGMERRAGTNPNDPNSFLAVAGVTYSGSDVTVTWDSVPGIRYGIEYTDDLSAGELGYNSISGVITATDVVTQVTISNAVTPDTPARTFRVTVVEW